MRTHLTFEEKKEQFENGYHWCTHHKEWEPVEEFYKNSSRPFGLQNYCKAARKVVNESTKHYRNNGNIMFRMKTPYKQGVYKIVDTLNNDEIVYIGSSGNLYNRHKDHLGVRKSGIHLRFNRGSYIGPEDQARYKFVAIEEENDAEKRKAREIYLIGKYNPEYNSHHRTDKE